MSPDTVRSELKDYYDGFSFDERARHHVYCPWSVLNFLNRPDRGFQNYWYSSGGQPSVLMKYLSNHALSQPITYAEVRELRRSELNAARQYDDIGLDVLLTQAGYYTIREVTEDGYALLGYPNREVAGSMAELYANELTQGKRICSSAATPIRSAMEKGALEAVIDYFNAAVTAIDYHRYPIKDEASCRAYMQVLLIGAQRFPRWKSTTHMAEAAWKLKSTDSIGFSNSSLLAAHRKSPTCLMRQSINSVPVTTGRHPSTQIASVWHWFSTAKNNDSRPGNGPKSLQTGSPVAPRYH